MDNLRLFVSLNFPREVKEQVSQLQKVLQGAGADVKWVEKKNLHLTLKFLGDISVTLLPDIRNVLLEAAEKAKPPVIVLQNLGVFPGRGEPKVLWVGIREQDNHLVSLAERIDLNLSALGISRENKAFRPHLTIGRVRSQNGIEGLKGKFSEHKSFSPLGPQKIGNFQLVKSELAKQGPVYTILEEFIIPG